jgi:hypothetical protein
VSKVHGNGVKAGILPLPVAVFGATGSNGRCGVLACLANGVRLVIDLSEWLYVNFIYTV